jgi:acetyl-CoA carboxylase carboxyltransferase component
VTALVSVGAGTDEATRAGFRTLHDQGLDRTVMLAEVRGGHHHGALTPSGGATIARAIALAVDVGVPFVLVVDSSGAEIRDGVAGLHAWGTVAKSLARASGAIPTIVGVTGACVSGPALLLGIADAVIMTDDAFAYVTGPEAVGEFTGVPTDRARLGGAGIHDFRSGVATFVVSDEPAMLDALALLLTYLPDQALLDPPRLMPEVIEDPLDRRCEVAATIVPERPTAAFDVRDVLDDVLDAGSVCEVRARFAPNVVTAFGRLAGRAVGVVANQPNQRAGTLDIEASRKAARFVAWCDAFNLPILTFVDTPGFEPGKDLEWRGMIRHGAELVHAYCQASVPRLCVIMRKSFGGAYIVMDSRGIANDVCLAWPTAEIAVMGAPGAVQILGSKGVTEDDYTEAFLNPYRAAERGFVDAVIDPADTRAVLGRALEQMWTKRDPAIPRKHSNSPQ